MAVSVEGLDLDYFRLRDFEYAQPLYDLAFLLEVDALANSVTIPKYRSHSLWRAALSIDSYGTNVARWLDGLLGDDELDYVPSTRIRQYLVAVGKTGSVPELARFKAKPYQRAVRLRAIRGLGPAKLAQTIAMRSLSEDWLADVTSDPAIVRQRVVEISDGTAHGPWQKAHVVPPLVRFVKALQDCHGAIADWDISGLNDPLAPVVGPVTVATSISATELRDTIDLALRRQRLFRVTGQDGPAIRFAHQMGWSFSVSASQAPAHPHSIFQLAEALDPLATARRTSLQADLHVHSAWSDGNAPVEVMASAARARGLSYIAITDHSRSSKLQGGLTPARWLKQASAIKMISGEGPLLHGIEVDILKDGRLDLPESLLAAADLVVASVHTNWTDDTRSNTDRLVRAIESGHVDILAHPTSAVLGKPGAPDYVRKPAEINWDEIIALCARWRVALEFNCFPSRFDLPILLLQKAASVGCAISFGSDAHARAHLLNLRFADTVLDRIEISTVLNRFSFDQLRRWVRTSRGIRAKLARTSRIPQTELFNERVASERPALAARICPPQLIPEGSRVVGIDLTAGNKLTGMTLLDGNMVETCSLSSDPEILSYIKLHRPSIVSIDSPLGLPGGGATVNPAAGIMRVAEHDLASIGIPAYPAMIESMANLTLRGIGLKRAIEKLPRPPRVIESYPGAAQDVLSIPRKQQSLDLLRAGLRRLGLTGAGLDTKSHDEMDAITSAIVGRYFESGQFEPMGIPSEAQLIVPKVSPMTFDDAPVICLAGKTGAGKSVAARYLSVFFGFSWIRTRHLIRDLLTRDSAAPPSRRMFYRAVAPGAITEADLREFGTVILEKYEQQPVQELLTSMVRQSQGPTVVDAIRGKNDVDVKSLGNRPVITWFIDCSEPIIRTRLAKRSRMSTKLPTASTVDSAAPSIRAEAQTIISNVRSLEDFRWRLDDALFANLQLDSG